MSNQITLMSPGLWTAVNKDFPGTNSIVTARCLVANMTLEPLE